MILYAFIAGLSLVLAYGIGICLPQGDPYSRGTRGRALLVPLWISLFLVLLVPAALRQATGNDYMRYVELFHLADVFAYVPTEEGFNWFVRLVYGLCGYENYLLVFALFAAMTIGFFLAAIRRLSKDFFFSFALFMLFGYYFQSYNTVRYYLVLAMVLYALHFLLEGLPVPFALLVLLASTFHKSALVALVLYPLCLLPWKKWVAPAFGLLGALVLLFQDRAMDLFVRLYPSYLDTDILVEGGHLSLPNLLRCALVLLVVALSLAGEKGSLRERVGDAYARVEEDLNYRFYVHAAILSLYIYAFGFFIPEVSRIAYYLVITQIILLPMAAGRIEESRIQRLLRAGILLFAVFSFVFFLRRAYTVTIRILPYQSFLFSDLPETPSRSIE